LCLASVAGSSIGVSERNYVGSHGHTCTNMCGVMQLCPGWKPGSWNAELWCPILSLACDRIPEVFCDGKAWFILLSPPLFANTVN